MLMVRVVDVLLPTLTALGQTGRKFRIQLQREVFSVQSRGPELGDELGGNNGVECRAVVNKQHSYIGIAFVPVSEGSEECNTDCVICGLGHNTDRFSKVYFFTFHPFLKATR